MDEEIIIGMEVGMRVGRFACEFSVLHWKRGSGESEAFEHLLAHLRSLLQVRDSNRRQIAAGTRPLIFRYSLWSVTNRQTDDYDFLIHSGYPMIKAREFNNQYLLPPEEL